LNSSKLGTTWAMLLLLFPTVAPFGQSDTGDTVRFYEIKFEHSQYRELNGMLRRPQNRINCGFASGSGTDCVAASKTTSFHMEVANFVPLVLSAPGEFRVSPSVGKAISRRVRM
jgi:hypothetical protein